jgi:hypothetical protein
VREFHNMSTSWMRTAAISCLLAGSAMIAGPCAAGAAVASADLFGIDIDILDIFGDDDHKKKSDHPTTRVDAQQNESRREERKVGLPGLNAPRVGFDPAESAGGGAVPRSGGADRPSTLQPVPTAPSGRTVVIRAEPPAPAALAPGAAAQVVAPPVVPLPVVPPVPVIVPLMPPALAIGAPAPEQSPAQPPAEIRPPLTNRQPAPADSLRSPAPPTSFRAGYADYLRDATFAGLMAAALPGIAGIFAFTTAGGLVGYRQARAVQTLPPAGIARFL